MDKEARDIANTFGQAAKMEGKFVQAFDNYEDLPDRVLVTTRKYVRISDEEIEMKYLYVNKHPDVVVIVEPTIIKEINILRGMPEGGLLVINTNRPIDYMLKFIPNVDLLGAVATVDADGISGVRTVDFSGSEGGVDTAGIGAGIAAPILGAMAKVTGMVKKENLAKVVSDVAPKERGYQEARIQKFRRSPPAAAARPSTPAWREGIGPPTGSQRPAPWGRARGSPRGGGGAPRPGAGSPTGSSQPVPH